MSPPERRSRPAGGGPAHTSFGGDPSSVTHDADLEAETAPVLRAAHTRGVVTVLVGCPYCTYAHAHRWAGDGGTRAAHCGRGHYRLVDPDAVLGGGA